MRYDPEGALALIHPNLWTLVSATQKHGARLADGSSLRWFLGFVFSPIHISSLWSCKSVIPPSNWDF